MKELSTVVLCLLAAILPCCILGCTPTEELELVDKVAGASVVLLGEVLRQYPTTHLSGRAYTAELKVYCILKADTVINSVHNISEAGVVDGRCFAATLNVGSRYIVLGYSSGSQINPYDDAVAATAENIQEVSGFCGLSPRLPAGISDSVMCPTHVDSKGCIISGPTGDHDDHSHTEHDHAGHGHDDHDDDHHSDDHSHDHDDHHHDDNEHDHDGDGEHTHDDHHDGHDHAVDDHDHDDHHQDHGHHDHDHAHDDHSDDHDAHAHDDHDHGDDGHDHHGDDHKHDDNQHDHDGDGVHDHDDHHDGHDHGTDDHDHDTHHESHEHSALSGCEHVRESLLTVLLFCLAIFL